MPANVRAVKFRNLRFELAILTRESTTHHFFETQDLSPRQYASTSAASLASFAISLSMAYPETISDTRSLQLQWTARQISESTRHASLKPAVIASIEILKSAQLRFADFFAGCSVRIATGVGVA